MSPGHWLIVYCALLLVASLVGGWLPMWLELTHRRLQLAVSFIAGAMLGVAVLHLLPHAVVEMGSIDQAAWWMMTGFLAMFLVERFFSFHHHDSTSDAIDAGVGDAPGDQPAHAAASSAAGDPRATGHVAPQAHGHDHAHHHGHHHRHGAGSESGQQSWLNQPFGWVGAAIGLSLHTLADGVALAASIEADAGHLAPGVLPGLVTFLAIALHKPLDAMTIGMLMAAAGWPQRTRHLVNALFALLVLVGAAAFLVGARRIAAAEHLVLGGALAFSAGTFLCIATSDLLPEVQFHRHDRVKLTAALLAGLSISWVISLVERQGHSHYHHLPAGDHDGGPASPDADPHDHGHDHTHDDDGAHSHVHD